ncbi:hypothetical protein [Streptomyces sp. RerS4]|uniref:hypothetical protein n=1 Tax=Streptomyces sp. RerS4 TaxID=2942449 RepID=UPI00201BABA2|nr:hypothetical protein [Streptomyces sp. RerS4]UQX04622.1 hypothetical protein M4D82_31990 [Streptomyces sp. RerS4]
MIRVRVRAAAYLAMTLACGSATPAAADGSLITVIDNSRADSVVEIDRAANIQSGSGSAGSDQEGSAVDVLATLLPTRPDKTET